MRYYTSKDDSWEIYWMQFNGSRLAEFLLKRGFHESSVWFMKDMGVLEQSYLDLLNEIELNNFERPATISTHDLFRFDSIYVQYHAIFQ